MNDIRESSISHQGPLFKTRPFKGNLSIGTPTKEFSRYMAEVRQTQDTYVSSTPPKRTEASDESIQRWSEKYDPEHMSQEEYRSFVDDLVSAGTLSETNKNYIGYSDMVCLGTLEEVASGNSSIAYDANSDVAPYETLVEAGGNARGWAAAWCGVVPSDRPSEFLNRRISAFDALSEIFDKMSAAKK